MEAGAVIRQARQEAKLSTRDLAARAGTSHATISAYEAGRKVPRFDTLERLVRAAGFLLDIDLAASIPAEDRVARGHELVEVLELAGAFPARHARTLSAPVFPPTPR